jgi:hypothetical protein
MSESNKRVHRRKFLLGIGGLSATLGLSAIGLVEEDLNRMSLNSQLGALEAQLSQTSGSMAQSQSKLSATQKQLAVLQSKWVAYGAGSNLKHMVDPSTGQSTVLLEELWGFGQDFVFCRVENNPQPFAMPTYKMGTVTVDANSFYMVMIGTRISIESIGPDPTGVNKIVLNGDLDCTTAAEVANVKFGSRSVSEPATFEVEASDDGEGGAFAITTYFSPDIAPVNNAIFGPKATFTGERKAGRVAIRPVSEL